MKRPMYAGVRGERWIAWRKLWRIKRFLAKQCGWKWYLGHEPGIGGAIDVMYLFWCKGCHHPSRSRFWGGRHAKYLLCEHCFTHHPS